MKCNKTVSWFYIEKIILLLHISIPSTRHAAIIQIGRFRLEKPRFLDHVACYFAIDRRKRLPLLYRYTFPARASYLLYSLLCKYLHWATWTYLDRVFGFVSTAHHKTFHQARRAFLGLRGGFMKKHLCMCIHLATCTCLGHVSFRFRTFPHINFRQPTTPFPSHEAYQLSIDLRKYTHCSSEVSHDPLAYLLSIVRCKYRP